MYSNRGSYFQVDERGRVVPSGDAASRYGLKPGVRVLVSANGDGLNIHRAPNSLAKLYIEPTNLCNLDCRTCIRNVWTEPMGKMSEAVFSRIIEGLGAFSPLPTVFFGGFGEPLCHPDIIEMVSRVKALGAKVELITNGTLLTREMSRDLVKAGLDMLWVSLDGATPEGYTDIRLGAALPQVLENLKHFREFSYAEYSSACCGFPPDPKTKLSIAFVAMKRNIAELPDVIAIGQRFGAESFSVSNVLPYNREMLNEVLYNRTMNNFGYRNLSLAEMDVDETTFTPIYKTIRKIFGTWAGFNSENTRNRCPFIESGSGAISWDGNLSPCLPLMHSHTSYLGFLRHEERFSRRWLIGNVTEQSLPDLWHAPEHLAFRERVQSFDFSPCTSCGGCDLSENNEEDCLGNKFPTCGGCLWAQGVIQCP